MITEIKTQSYTPFLSIFLNHIIIEQGEYLIGGGVTLTTTSLPLKAATTNKGSDDDGEMLRVLKNQQCEGKNFIKTMIEGKLIQVSHSS